MTTPAVLLVNDHVALTLATKLPFVSRLIANTVIELSARRRSERGTTVPEPLAAVSTRTWVAAPAVTVYVDWSPNPPARHLEGVGIRVQPASVAVT